MSLTKKKSGLFARNRGSAGRLMDAKQDLHEDILSRLKEANPEMEFPDRKYIFDIAESSGSCRRSVSFVGCLLRDEFVVALCDALKQHPESSSIFRIHLNSVHMSVVSALKLFQTLATSAHITEIFLDDMTWSWALADTEHEVFSSMAAAGMYWDMEYLLHYVVHQFPELQALRLRGGSCATVTVEGKDLDAVSVVSGYLNSALPATIGDDSNETGGSAFRSRLQMFFIESAVLSSRQMECIARMLLSNTALIHLSLRGCHFPFQSFQKISQSLTRYTVPSKEALLDVFNSLGSCDGTKHVTSITQQSLPTAGSSGSIVRTPRKGASKKVTKLSVAGAGTLAKKTSKQLSSVSSIGEVAEDLFSHPCYEQRQVRENGSFGYVVDGNRTMLSLDLRSVQATDGADMWFHLSDIVRYNSHVLNIRLDGSSTVLGRDPSDVSAMESTLLQRRTSVRRNEE